MADDSNGASRRSDRVAPRLEITRRNFLTFAGLAFSSSVLPISLTACNGGGGPAGGPQPDFTATLLRPTDLLSLALGFVNLKPSSDGTKLQPIHSGDPAYILVDFGPQHLIEQVYVVGVDDKKSPLPPADGKAVQALFAGNSRVVFLVPAGQSLDYTVPALLTAFSTLEMNVSDLSAPGAGVTAPKASKAGLKPANVPTQPVTVAHGPPPLPSAPTGWDTTLEMPARLVLAPNQYGGWAHALAEVTSSKSQRTELWHTRLGVRTSAGVDESDLYASARTVRAVWTRDPGFDPAASPPAMPKSDSTPWAALHDYDRARIVFESANLGTLSKPRTPPAIQVNRLMLTALGGWLDVRGDFGDAPASGLAEWQERATMGRDHYVKTVQTGVLYPFGHAAALVTVAERKLTDAAEALWQRSYLVIRQPTMKYDAGGDAMLAQQLRQLPFTELTITTLVTPDLLPVTSPSVPLLADTSQPYLFKMVALDHAGREVHFEAPAVWLLTQSGKIASGIDPTDVQTKFKAASPTSPLGGQRIAFGPEITSAAMSSSPSAGAQGGSSFETQSLSHTGWPGTSFYGGALSFVPQIDGASIAVEALRGLGNLSDAVDVVYHSAYLANGFGGGSGANAGDLLLQLVNAVGVDFSQHSDQSGGFLNPNLPLSALSRALGPVGGADMGSGAASDIASGNFDPTTFFDPSTLSKALSGAKIFGVFDLTSILPLSGLLDNAPKFLTQALGTVEAIVADAQKLQSLVQSLEDAASSQTLTLPSQLDTVVQSLKKNGGDLVTAIQAVVASPTDTTNITNAVTALTALPTALTQLPGALDAAAGQLPVNVASLTAQLKSVADTVGQALSAVSSTFSTILQAYATGQNLVKNLTLKLDWQTPIVGFPSGKTNVPDDIFAPTGGLTLSAELRLKAVDGRPAGLDLVCGLEAFDINLFGGSSTFLAIKFEHLLFQLKAGQKADVDCKLAKPGIVFEGPLSFVQTLTSVIPLDGFSDPPGIDVSPSGITASFTIGLPTLAVGVFSLQNISIGGGFKIPFIGDPLSVNFDFCTRDNPFIVTVSFLGGGGFFGITINPNGVEKLEASFEFGAGIAVDFGVASGSVSAMAGIYFKMEFDATTSTNDATLTGFFRLRGEVDVLGIITASIELYLELTYESSSGKVTGTATLDIDVSVFFFHLTVSVTCTKRFAGGNNDPSFVDVMQPANTNDAALGAPFAQVLVEGGAPGPGQIAIGYAPWQEYLAAFAA